MTRTLPSRALGILAALALLLPPAVRPQETAEASPPVGQVETVTAVPGEWSGPRELQALEQLQILSTRVGTGTLVTLPSEVERVALADNSIARIQIISPQEVLLTGLRPGETTVFIWLTDGGRRQHAFRVIPDVALLSRALWDLDPRIEVELSPDGAAMVLTGEVAGEQVSREADYRAQSLIGAAGGGIRTLNLLRYPGSVATVEDQLTATLAAIDDRIRVRRIQVGAEPDTERDTFVLEGRVKHIRALVRAVNLAERQLGGTGERVSAQEDDRVTSGRFRGGNFGGGNFGGNTGGGGTGGTGGGLIGGQDPRSSSLASQIARGLMVTSQSGRVISLLEVDVLHQVLVSIRVLEVDRVKARRAGFNLRWDGEHVSIGNYLSPQVDQLPAITTPSDVGGLGTNIVAAFVDQTASIVAAIDFLQEKDFARSVAEPNVLTLTGELASVVVGGEVPIPSTAATNVSTFQGVFFQEFGVRLDIRPTVTDDDIVALEVAPSISRPSASLAVGQVPGFTVQSVTTTARVQAGQGLVIGGLLSFDEGIEDRRLPGLGKIPLFRWKRKTRQERELLFVITPRLVEVPRADVPEPPVVQTPAEQIELPDLQWPEDRRHWSDEFDPHQARPDGVPPAFVAGDEVPGPSPGATDLDWGTGEVDPKAEDLDWGTGQVEPEATDLDWGTEPAAEPVVAPAAEPAVAPAPRTWRVAASSEPCLNLRAYPSVWGDRLDCLEPGTEVTILDEADGWRRVELADGRQGWVSEHLAAVSEAEAGAESGPESEDPPPR